MELSIKQLLFAHRIGAKLVDIEPPIFFYKLTGGSWRFHKDDVLKGQPSVYGNPAIDCGAVEIDFTPLYDWIEHDGGECPVRDDDVVEIRVNGRQTSILMSAHSVPDWTRVTQFKLAKLSEDWPEQRAQGGQLNNAWYGDAADKPETIYHTNWSQGDEQRQEVIDQNGNTGEHYEIPPPEYDPRDVAFNAETAGPKSKYHREISPGIWVDVYDVLKAWNVTCPALQHLTKKALQPGERGHKTLEQDMKDIVASAKRAQELSNG